DLLGGVSLEALIECPEQAGDHIGRAPGITAGLLQNSSKGLLVFLWGGDDFSRAAQRSDFHSNFRSGLSRSIRAKASSLCVSAPSMSRFSSAKASAGIGAVLSPTMRAPSVFVFPRRLPRRIHDRARC